MNQIVVTKSLSPRTLEEAMQFAQMLAKSTMVPKDFQGRPENIIVAIQWGAEVGLGPLQALQNIAVVNGRPSIWGDAALALVQGSGQCEEIKEWIEGEGDKRIAYCETKRKGRATIVKQKFGVDDAKRAGLWGRQGPWTQYTERMLQMRARSFALRDAYPDVLKGVILAEEAQDIEPKNVTPQRGNPIRQEYAQIADEIEACGDQEQLHAFWQSDEIQDFLKRAEAAANRGMVDYAGQALERYMQRMDKIPPRKVDKRAHIESTADYGGNPPAAPPPSSDHTQDRSHSAAEATPSEEMTDADRKEMDWLASIDSCDSENELSRIAPQIEADKETLGETKMNRLRKTWGQRRAEIRKQGTLAA